MLEPAAKALNITVKEDTTNGIQDVRAQITAGAVAWDVTEQIYLHVKHSVEKVVWNQLITPLLTQRVF